jgi:hypothetical protein
MSIEDSQQSNEPADNNTTNETETSAPPRSKKKKLLLGLVAVLSLLLLLEVGVAAYRQIVPERCSCRGICLGIDPTMDVSGGTLGSSLIESFGPNWGEDYRCGPSTGPLFFLTKRLVHQVGIYYDTVRLLKYSSTTLRPGADVCFTRSATVYWDIEFVGINPQGERVRVPRKSLVSRSSLDDRGVVGGRRCMNSATGLLRPTGIWMYYQAEREELGPGSTVRAYAVKDNIRLLFAEINIK